MSDDIRAMTSELARDPGSLVFIRLGETLRERGQIDAAGKVARAGLERNPDSIEGHDLHARVLVDAGDPDGAEREWTLVLGADPRHLGAHKGLGFLCYRRGDVDGALDHLELALSVDPTDPSVVQALHTVRGAMVQGAPPAAAPMGAPAEAVADLSGETQFSGVEGADRAMLLVDPQGRVLGGGLRNSSGSDVAAVVAAQLAGVSQEAERTARMLDLGDWSSIVAEAADGNMFLCQPTPQAVLLLVRDRSVPPARMQVIAEKAAHQARAWIESQAP